MIIKVERIPAENFAQLVAFIDKQEVKKPVIYVHQLDLKIYNDPPDLFKPIILRKIEHDESGLYSFDIVFYQLVEVEELGILGVIFANDFEGLTIKGILNKYPYHAANISITIPRGIIDGIMDILDIFPSDTDYLISQLS